VISAFFVVFFFFFYEVMLAIFKCEFLEAAKAKPLSFKKQKKNRAFLWRKIWVLF